jgi:glycosyltransferase involved in cell wall biosynthesis
VTRVLFLAYHFPPVGGAGVQRPTRFVRYLPDFGYEPVVVTGPGAAEGRWTPRDDTLESDVPPGTAIHRISATEPRSTSWGNRRQRWLRVDSPWSAWWKAGATELGKKVGRDVDLIYAWMQPYESASVASQLAHELGKPWVADLGDPWALDEMIVYPSRLHRRLELRKMGKLLGSAAAISMSTEEAAARVRSEFGELNRRPVVAIQNGFDAHDFTGPPPSPDPEVFRIVHTGYLHTAMGQKYHRFALVRRVLGGAVPGVDVLPRSHVYLLQALDRLLEARPELRGRIELHLAGVLSDADRAVIGDNEAVKVHEYVAHAEAVSMMRAADLLFLPMHNLEGGRRATIVPGKLYEYLAARRPILAAVPEGDAKDLLTRAGNASICPPDDVAAMVGAIATYVDRNDSGRGAPESPPDLIRQFDYRRLAERLAHVFDNALAGAR